jgi:hypothetical protein
MHNVGEVEVVVELVRTSVIGRVRDAAAFLLVGSHAEGNANAASDIDLIGVVHAPPRSGPIATEALVVNGHAVVIQYIGADRLRRKIDGLDLLYRAGRQAVDSMATRIADAVLVHDTDGMGAALIARARKYRPSPATLREFARASMTFYQDALGSIDNRDPETAILMARQAATFVVDCFLLNRGFRSLKPKWHLRRLRQADAAGVMERYRRVLGLDNETDQMRALNAFAELDRLICEVLQISRVDEFERSPLWNSDAADD